jgi:hypothetical protein
MPTPLQHRLIRVAYRELKLNEAQQRMLLRTVAGVESHKDLSNAAFEDCMAVLECQGFTDSVNKAGYWQGVVERRGNFCNPRMARMIHNMAFDCRYTLVNLVMKFSDGRTSEVDELKPREAWMLIEMLKAVKEREAAKTNE